MSVQDDCILRHRARTHLHCNCLYSGSVHTIASLSRIDEIADTIIKKADFFPSWMLSKAKLTYSVTLIIHEACMNAIEHGVLRLTRDDKRRLLEELEERYIEHISDQYDKSQTPIRVTVCMNNERVLIGVHDDGPGFEFNKSENSSIAETDLMACSGRGLAMLKGMGVSLNWNEKGNSILCRFDNPAPAVQKAVKPVLLLVDDDEIIRYSYRRLFENAGMEVTDAEDGSDALTVLEKNRPDIILVDMFMPRMDGSFFIRQVRERLCLKSIPIIAMSAVADWDMAANVLKVGANRFMFKPVSRQGMVSAVSEFLPMAGWNH